MQTQKKPMTGSPAQRVDKPSHSVSGLRAGAHECQFAPRQCSSFLGLQRFSITLKRRRRAKIKIILALCQ
ncbi:hypothetical protein [Bacillus safensis]|uniref:hypothetical protein n=1 Tax=Bacillus safensis TaxID=561879 RepID=UPI002E1EDAE6|nr:hypothetical protein [Bacillus safensis]